MSQSSGGDIREEALLLLREALDFDTDVERERLLDERCTDRPDLRDRVNSMLGRVAADGGDIDAGNDSVDALLGQQLGAFRVVERIGRGGMGVVYRGLREGSDFAQEVAIKLIRRGFDFDDVQARFLRERRILARLSHPNLAHFVDGGVTADGRPWFALEFIRGQSITRWCDAQRLDVRARVQLFLDVCAAVQHAHTQLVVHRDLKPGNVLVDRTGMVRLLDFGVAGLLTGDGDSDDGGRRSTIAQRHALTPEYAAPEQFAGEGVGVTVDVYALGVTLYELIAGVLPYAIDRDNPVAAELAVRERPPQPLAQAVLRAGTTSAHAVSTGNDVVRRRLASRNTSEPAFRAVVRGDLSRIIDKALAKEPARRYPTVQAFADDLGRWLAGTPVHVSGNGFAYRADKFVRRHRVSVALTTLLVITLVVATIAIFGQWHKTLAESAAALQMKDQLVAVIQQTDHARLGDTAPAAAQLLAQSVERLQQLQPGSPLRRELAAEVVLMLAPLGDDALTMKVAERELGADPAHGARSPDVRLRQTIAWAIGMMDRSDEVLPVLREVVETSRDASPLLLAEALTSLAEVEIATGHMAQAVGSAERALALLQPAVAVGDPRTAYARFALAAARVGIRDTEGGRAQSERVLVELPVTDSRLRAFALTKAALRRAVLGDFHGAESAYVEGDAMVARLAYSAPRRFDDAMHAVNAFDLGQLDRARSLIEPIRRSNEESPHDPVWEPWSANWLSGELDMQSGQFEQAAVRFGEAAGQAERQGESFREFALYNRALHQIAQILAGIPHDEGDMRDMARSQPPPKPSYATAMLQASRGLLLGRQQRPADALLAFDAALDELARAQLQPIGLREQLMERRDGVRIRYWRAQLLRDAGSMQYAASALRDAQQWGLRTLGAQHPFLRDIEGYAPSSHASPVVGQ